MDDLRHDHFEHAPEDDVEVAPLDSEALDRLAAYGREVEAAQAPAVAVEPVEPLSDTVLAPLASTEPMESPVSDTSAVEDDAFGDMHAPPVQAAPVGNAEPAPAVPEVVVEPVASEERPASRFGRRDRAHKSHAVKEKRDRRARQLVGLKIGASQIAAAQIANNGAPELLEVFREPLEPGLVVSGEIRDADTLGDALKRFFELHKLPKKGVRLGVSNNRIGVRIFEIEGVSDPRQLENAIRFRAEEVLPIPLDQSVFDYVVLDERVREDGSEWKRILLVVAYREVVERYLQACRRAGIQVVGVDLEAFALLRSLAAPAERDARQGALVAVAIGHDRTTIAVSTGRNCEFARVIDWGGFSLNVAVARVLDRAPSEVEQIKRQLSFARPTEVEGLTPEQVTKTRDGAQRALATFARELVASLQFYQAQPGALGIGEIVLTGGSAHMDGLPEVVGELVGVPVRLGDPFTRVKVGPRVALEEQHGSVAVAIGLGIED